MPQICRAANQGDALACEVIEYVGRYLGKAIAIAINLFNPQKWCWPAKLPMPTKCCSRRLRAALTPGVKRVSQKSARGAV